MADQGVVEILTEFIAKRRPPKRRTLKFALASDERSARALPTRRRRDSATQPGSVAVVVIYENRRVLRLAA